MGFDKDAFVIATIVNAEREKELGKWISFPSTTEDIKKILAEIKVDGKNSNFNLTTGMLNPQSETRYTLPKSAHIDELNYLSKLLLGYEDKDDVLKFESALSVAKNPTMKDIINIAINVDCYELRPELNESMYSDFLWENEIGSYHEIIFRLLDSLDQKDRAFAAYVEMLIESVDINVFTRNHILGEGGKFTVHGYLIKHADFKNTYEGIENIPKEFRVLAYPEFETPSFAVQGVLNDEMLGRFLYNNKPPKQKLATDIKLNFTADKASYFRQIGKKFRERHNGCFTKDGYVEYNHAPKKTAVLKQIAVLKNEHKNDKPDLDKHPKSKDSER